MKKNYWFLIVFLLISCSSKDVKKYSEPQKVIIAGKVENYDAQIVETKIVVNQLGAPRQQINTQIDSLGHFSGTFEIYTPTDLWLQYKTNFLVLAHPGDSIYVVFNDNSGDRPEILKSIKFSGDAAKTNQDAAQFQRMYYSTPLYYDWDAKRKAIKEYEVDQYISYLDTMQQKSIELYNSFVETVFPNQETKMWALTFIEQDYYNALAFYPQDHRDANRLNYKEWNVPISYYNPLLKRLPIKESMFISGYALSSFINRFHSDYALRSLRDEASNNKDLTLNESTPKAVIDSIIVNGLIKYTPDDLLRQMVLTEHFSQKFENADVKLFEQYKDLAENYIKEPYLKEPLWEFYNKVKSRLENPQIASDALLKKLDSSSAGETINAIRSEHKGNIIYIDCWATWCPPCRDEMPHSKKLMTELETRDVSFIYLCLDSEEKLWKASLDEFELGGQHYFLTKQQSNDIRAAFEIPGMPFYILIDKKGTIVETGSHLRPRRVKEKIEKLFELNKNKL